MRTEAACMMRERRWATKRTRFPSRTLSKMNRTATFVFPPAGGRTYRIRLPPSANLASMESNPSFW